MTFTLIKASNHSLSFRKLEHIVLQVFVVLFCIPMALCPKTRARHHSFLSLHKFSRQCGACHESIKHAAAGGGVFHSSPAEGFKGDGCVCARVTVHTTINLTSTRSRWKKPAVSFRQSIWLLSCRIKCFLSFHNLALSLLNLSSLLT